MSRSRPTADPDTIFAVATGVARAAIAVVRVSGPHAAAVAIALVGRVPAPRVATLARLRDPATDETLDHALVLFFEAARSEIGEDGLELHLHGSPAVVAAVLGALARCPGLRPAEPGEFARRAFANGKLDLAQLEGLADLIDAETEWQRRQAQRQLSGAMRDATAPWRAALIEAAAAVETAIDFAEDVELDDTHGRVAMLMAPVRAGLSRELARGRAAERVRDGVQIVIAGPPNAGKSTLLNALARREAAIVSAIAGTTRDPIEVHLDLGGCPVTLVDTAGLRESADPIERIGVFRARERAKEADLVLWLSEGEPPPTFSAPAWRLAAKADTASSSAQRGKGTMRSLAQGAAAASIDPPVVGDGGAPGRNARQDAAGGEAVAAPSPGLHPLPRREEDALPISARTGRNLDVLIERLTGFAQDLARSGAAGLLARARHRAAFEAAAQALAEACDPFAPVEIVAEQLRAARFALDRLIGIIDVEDILGDIFSRFCIGK